MTVVGSLLLVALGPLAGLAVLAASRSVLAAMSVMLELWTAAGLLRLSADATWSALAIAAVMVLLRRVLSAAIRSRARPRPRRTAPA